VACIGPPSALYRASNGLRPGPDDHKAGPKPVIEGSWTGPADGPPPWLRKVPPVKSEDRPPATPPQTKSGGETEAQRQRVNADRSVEHRVMGNPRLASADFEGVFAHRYKRWRPRLFLGKRAW